MSEDRLESLLLSWQELQLQGRDVPAAEMCHDCPELADELDRRIRFLRQMNALVQEAGDHSKRDAEAWPWQARSWQTGFNDAAGGGTLRSRDGCPPASLPQVDSIPGYEILQELGRGGMGVVYKARQVNLNRTVALKMILAGSHASANAMARFLKEAETIARLKHPQIVQVHEFGSHAGMPYFCMEYLEGGSLADKISSQPQSPGAAARMVEMLAQAVSAAHEQGIIHRDLKPGNVLLDSNGTLKITDFGLAKEGDAGTTATGEVLGTPSYMAPEQAAGKVKEIGPAADIYALGAILYELLTARPPFKGATAWDTLQMVTGAEPVPPSQFQAKIPRDLETICLKCLQKDPARRYSSAQALAEDLQRFSAGEPIVARPVGRAERLWRWCQRKPALAIALASVALSLLAGTVISVIFAVRAAQALEAESLRALSEAAAKKEADRARRDAQKQLIDLCGASGLAAAREGDHSLALLWFARAVQLASDEPERDELNRIRINNWLRQVSLPVGSFSIPGFRQGQDRFRTFQFSEDGKYLLVLASAGNCMVWDRPQRMLVPLPGLAGQISAAAWQPKSGFLAAALTDGRIQFLAPPRFQAVQELAARSGIVALAFSQDGKRLAWGGPEGAWVWDQADKEYACPMLAHPQTVVSVSFNATGDQLATAALDNKARVFRITRDAQQPLFPPVTVEPRAEYGSNHGGPDRVAPRFAANDQVLLTVSNNRLMWHSAATGKLLTSTAAPPGEGLARFAVSAQGNQVAVLWEYTGLLMDAQSRRILAAVPTKRQAWTEDADFAADGKALVTCGLNRVAQLWSVGERTNYNLGAAAPPIFHPNQVVRVSLAADGRHLATARWDGAVSLWSLPQKAPVAYTAPCGGITLPALSSDGRFLMPRGLSYRNANLRHTRVHDAISGASSGPNLDPGGIILDAAFSPDGKQVAIACSKGQSPQERNALLFEMDGKGGNVQIFDWKNGKRLCGPIPTPGEPRGLAYRPDGRSFAVVCADYRALLVDASNGKIMRTLDPGIRTRPANANFWHSNGEPRFSPDGKFLVTWEMSPHVHVWDPDRGQLLHTLPHNDRVETVSFNPTMPALLASGGRDSMARIWDLASGKVRTELQHPQWVRRLRFSSDGAELFTACDDGMFRVWDWRAKRLNDGLLLHSKGLLDFGRTKNRRWLLTLDMEELQMTDWRFRVPSSPLWQLKGDHHLEMAIPAGDARVIASGFSGSLVGYDLTAMATPATATTEVLVRLAELIAGRRILRQERLVPLSGAEWAEHWERLHREDSPLRELGTK